MGLAQVMVEDAPAVVAALKSYEDGIDFADALHLAAATKAEVFATFDARLKKRAGRQANIKLL